MLPVLPAFPPFPATPAPANSGGGPASPVVRELTVADGSLRLTVEHGEEALPVLLRTLDGAGITMSAISLSRPTLDDVFLTLTGRSLRDDSPRGADGAEGSGGEPELAGAGTAGGNGTTGKE